MATGKRTETAVMKVGASAPSFLQQYVKQDDKSLDGLKEYRVLPRAKVIQGMTDQGLKSEFGEGSIIMWPGRRLVAPKQEQFLFAPVFFFTEFCTWRDRRDKGGAAIMARSNDKGGEIAAKSRDAEKRQEKYEGGPADKPYMKRHVEHLNFAGLVYQGNVLTSDPIVIGFSRGEFSQGKNFCSAIMMRKVNGVPAPLWSQVWAMATNTRTRNDNTWWGVDFANPDEPWIKEEEVGYMQQLHADLGELFKADRLVVDLSDADDEAVDAATVVATAEM